MSKAIFSVVWLAACAVLPVSAHAQTQQTIVINGGSNIQISGDQKLMFAAMTAVMKKDYKTAESLYTQAIAINGNNINAYVQRGIIRREMGDEAGRASDGHSAITLANNALQNNPHDPDLYYERGMGYRLIKDFDQAEKDIRTGMAQGGQSGWQTDIQAIELEKKTGL